MTGAKPSSGLRAERLAALGAAEVVTAAELSPQTLAAAIERAASRQLAALADRHRRCSQTAADSIVRMIGARRAPSLVGRQRRSSYDPPMSYYAAGRCGNDR